VSWSRLGLSSGWRPPPDPCHSNAPTQPRSPTYRRLQEGKTRREATRCLKRRVARNLYRLLRTRTANDGLTNIEASLAQVSVLGPGSSSGIRSGHGDADRNSGGAMGDWGVWLAHEGSTLPQRSFSPRAARSFATLLISDHLSGSSLTQPMT
jgi:hypothetical protein